MPLVLTRYIVNRRSIFYIYQKKKEYKITLYRDTDTDDYKSLQCLVIEYKLDTHFRAFAMTKVTVDKFLKMHCKKELAAAEIGLYTITRVYGDTW